MIWDIYINSNLNPPTKFKESLTEKLPVVKLSCRELCCSKLLRFTSFWKRNFKLIYFLYQFNFIFRKELLKASTNVWSKSFIKGVKIFCNLILRNHWIWTWKILDCLTGLRLTLWYIGPGFKKYLNNFNGLRLVSWYIGVILEKYLDYLGFGVILWYTGLVLEEH